MLWIICTTVRTIDERRTSFQNRFCIDELPNLSKISDAAAVTAIATVVITVVATAVTAVATAVNGRRDGR